MLLDRGMGEVLADLAALGMDAEWGVLGASDLAGDHHRKRIWILGYSDRNRRERGAAAGDDTAAGRSQPAWRTFARANSQAPWDRFDHEAEPGEVGTADGLAHRVDRLKAIGNGQIPRVAATAFDLLRR